MTAVGDAAAAILGAGPQASRFPAVGVIRRLSVYRGERGTGPITGIGNLAVSVDDVLYPCGWSGAFAAEIESAAPGVNSPGFEFVGRQVKVELLGGVLIVAYTLNRS